MGLAFKQGMNNYCELGTCRLDNIYVKCGDDAKRRKRSPTDNKKLIIEMKMNIPIPKNSTVNFSSTLQKVENTVIKSINKSASNLEVNGTKLTLREIPKSRVLEIKCEKGQIVKGSSCGMNDIRFVFTYFVICVLLLAFCPVWSLSGHFWLFLIFVLYFIIVFFIYFVSFTQWRV